jgi:hypothetical protein
LNRPAPGRNSTGARQLGQSPTFTRRSFEDFGIQPW